jgi:hypothetical protein
MFVPMPTKVEILLLFYYIILLRFRTQKSLYVHDHK